MKVLVMHQPEDYFQWPGVDISDQFVAKNETPGLIHLFEESTAIFKKEMLSVLNFVRRIHQ